MNSTDAQLLNMLVLSRIFTPSVFAVWSLSCLLQHNIYINYLHSVCTIFFSIACLCLCSLHVRALISQLSGASFELYLCKLSCFCAEHSSATTYSKLYLGVCQDRHQQPRRQQGAHIDLPRPPQQRMAPGLALLQGQSGHVSCM